MIVTATAAQQIQKLCGSHEFFRIQVKAGGCSGFEHSFSITQDLDTNLDVQLGQVVMDSATQDILQNATLDWKSDLSGEQFVLTVPEATVSCGCGKSFSLF